MNKVKFYFYTIIATFCFFSFLYFRYFFRTERPLPFNFSYLYFFSTLGLLLGAIYVCYTLIKSIRNSNTKEPNFLIKFILKYFENFIISILNLRSDFENELYQKFRKYNYYVIFKFQRKLNKFIDYINRKQKNSNLIHVIYFYLYLFPKILLTCTLFIDIVIFHKIYFILYISNYLFIHFGIIIILYIIKRWYIHYFKEILTIYDPETYYENNKCYIFRYNLKKFFLKDLPTLHYSFFIYQSSYLNIRIILEFYITIYDIAKKPLVKYINLFLQFIIISTSSYVLFKIILNII